MLLYTVSIFNQLSLTARSIPVAFKDGYRLKQLLSLLCKGLKEWQLLAWKRAVLSLTSSARGKACWAFYLFSAGQEGTQPSWVSAPLTYRTARQQVQSLGWGSVNELSALGSGQQLAGRAHCEICFLYQLKGKIPTLLQTGLWDSSGKPGNADVCCKLNIFVRFIILDVVQGCMSLKTWGIIFYSLPNEQAFMQLPLTLGMMSWEYPPVPFSTHIKNILVN